jgi:hypothetical protein
MIARMLSNDNLVVNLSEWWCKQVEYVRPRLRLRLKEGQSRKQWGQARTRNEGVVIIIGSVRRNDNARDRGR